MGTFVVGAILVGVVAFVIRSMIRDYYKTNQRRR